MKKILSLFLTVSLLLSLQPSILQAASAELRNTVRGRILLDVESNGEAWYVHPDSDERYFLGRPADAFELMRSLGLGISNENLAKIEVGLAGEQTGADSDGDGLPDGLEIAFGTNPESTDSDGDGFDDFTELTNGFSPIGEGRLQIDGNFAASVSGKILLQVERNGEAWYVSPVNLRRYYLGRPADAFALMRALGLGISRSNLNEVSVSRDSVEDPNQTEAPTPPPPAQQPPAEEPVEEPVEEVAPATLIVEGGEFFLSTDSSISLSAGQALIIEFRNFGTVNHNVEVEGTSLATATIGSDQTASVTIPANLLSEGTITLFCNIGSHRQLGMETTVSVSRN